MDCVYLIAPSTMTAVSTNTPATTTGSVSIIAKSAGRLGHREEPRYYSCPACRSCLTALPRQLSGGLRQWQAHACR